MYRTPAQLEMTVLAKGVFAMEYLGSKAASGASQQIIALMPPHDTYIEAYLGTGAVLARKPPSLRTIGIERDDVMIDYARTQFPDTQLVHGDALTFLRQFDYAAAGRTLIYADPPYLESTRTSSCRYRHEYGYSDHLDMLDVLKQASNAGAMVMLSGYPNELYDEALPGWYTHTFQAMTRGGVRTEKLWLSYQPGAAYWSTFAGKDYIERQRIKRKAERWAARYSALPPAERIAVLAAMLDMDIQLPVLPVPQQSEEE